MNDQKKSNGSLFSRIRRKLGQLICPAPDSMEDLLELIQQATRRNLIEHDVNLTIKRVLRVSELKVKDVMIPRAHMVTLDIDSDINEILKIVTESGHSRFPVLGGHSDNEQLGILLAKDILHYRLDESDDFSLHDNLRNALSVPEAMRLNTLLKLFQESHNHMAIVVNEYNDLAGLVTIEDVLEEIVGEIEDESDYEETETITKTSDNQYMVLARTEIEDFNEHFNVNIDEDTDTIGGVILKLAGKVPDVGERFSHKGFTFEITHADERKITSLRVTLAPADPSESTV